MSKQDEFHQPYKDYATTLRAWLVGYGVGAPVLFLTQDAVAKAISGSGEATCLVVAFLAGVGLQVFIAVVNKWNNWYLYAKKPASGTSKRYSFAEWLSEFWLLDLFCDLGAIVLFGWATSRSMLAVLS